MTERQTRWHCGNAARRKPAATPGAGTEGWISRCCSSPRGGGGCLCVGCCECVAACVRVSLRSHGVEVVHECVWVNMSVTVCLHISEWVHVVCACPSVLVCVPLQVRIPASAKCLRERHLQKASGKESQNNKGNLASSDVLYVLERKNTQYAVCVRAREFACCLCPCKYFFSFKSLCFYSF